MRNMLQGVEFNTPKLNGFFRAYVIDNNDKLSLGRIKIKVYPHFKDIPDKDLPWAQPCWWMPMQIPPKNSWVWVFFEEGDPLKPVYIGQALPVGIKESLQVSTCADGEQAGKQHMHPRTWFTEANIEYPDGYIIRTPNKFVFYVNDKTGEVRIQSDKAEKSHLHFKDNGDVYLWAGGDLHLRAAGLVHLDDPQAPGEWCGNEKVEKTVTQGTAIITNPRGYPVETYEDYETYTEMVSNDVDNAILTATSNQEVIDNTKEVLKKYMAVESELGNQIVAKARDIRIRLDFPVKDGELFVLPKVEESLLPEIPVDQSTSKVSALTSVILLPLAKEILDKFPSQDYSFESALNNSVILLKKQVDKDFLVSLYLGYLSDVYINSVFGKVVFKEKTQVSELMSLGKLAAWFEIIKMGMENKV